MRPQFYPDQLQAMVLFDFVREEYGNHTLEEFKLAFRKAITTGYEGLEENDIKVFDYFNPAYFARIMKHYRLWAAETGNKIADEKYIEQLKKTLPPPSEVVVDWRQVIEQDYQFFLQGVEACDTFPEEHHRILVEDGAIQGDWYLKKIDKIRQNILHNLNASLVVLQKSATEQSERASEYYKVKNLLDEYRQGKRDKDFELKAKQLVVRTFFSYNRKQGNEHIYQPK